MSLIAEQSLQADANVLSFEVWLNDYIQVPRE